MRVEQEVELALGARLPSRNICEVSANWLSMTRTASATPPSHRAATRREGPDVPSQGAKTVVAARWGRLLGKSMDWPVPAAAGRRRRGTNHVD
jgi:hypothetical protein